MASRRQMWTGALKQLGTVEGADAGYVPRPGVGRHGNHSTFVDGYRFASKLEADRYRELVLLRSGGAVRWFLRQVPFDVAPGVVYRCDFLVVWNLSGTAEDSVTIEDTKGHLTQTSRTKIAVVQERYGIRIRILTRADVRRS